METAATPWRVFDSRPIMIKIRVTCFTNFVNCLPPPWRWHCRSYSGIPNAKISGLEAIFSSWRRSWVLWTPTAFVPMSLTFHIVVIWDNWTIPFLTASWIHNNFPDKCFTFPVPCLIPNWRPEEESVNITCSTSALKTNSKHRLRDIPSLRVLILACNSPSQLDKLTALNSWWSKKKCTIQQMYTTACRPTVNLFGTPVAVTKLSRIQCLSEDLKIANVLVHQLVHPQEHSTLV